MLFVNPDEQPLVDDDTVVIDVNIVSILTMSTRARGAGSAPGDMILALSALSV